MKKTSIIIGFALCCQLVIAQQDTSYITNEMLHKKIENLESDIYNIKHDFMAFNRQYNTGTRLYLIGIGMIYTGSYLILREDKIRSVPDFPILLLFGGSALQIVGFIIQLDSHKYLGGGRSLTLGSGGLSYRF